MRVLRARNAGFCMGVALAMNKLDLALNAPRRTGRIVTFGPLIHNPQVLDEYAQKGAVCTEVLADIQPGDSVIIRAHGIPRAMETALKKAGAQLIDATCPRVKKAQQGIAAQDALKRRLLLLGEAEHPEVRGLISYAQPGALVFSSLKELQELAPEPSGAWFLATQTTQGVEEFEKVAAWLVEHMEKEIPVLSTICEATRLRQEEARNLAGQANALVVVGGLNSGNTRRLAQVAEEMAIPAYHIEKPEQLPLAELKPYALVGLTAGASTPKRQIDEVQRVLENL